MALVIPPRIFPVLVLFIFAAGCAAPSARLPIEVMPGASRSEAATMLKNDDYCRKDGPERPVETYARCDSPGLEFGDSWVTVRYRGGVVQRVQRFERHADQAAATKRWRQLVDHRRQAHGPESKIARESVGRVRGIPTGAQTWLAWHSPDFKTLAAVYLLRPSIPGEPNILEEVLPDPSR